jgi:hypothetical protein
VFLYVQVYSTLWRNCVEQPETTSSTTKISVQLGREYKGRTPTFERPRTATSGDSAWGNWENFPTVKRRIGAGAKNFKER